ncbi:glycosyltransferase [Micromonospora sp. NPDC005806]|uniref:glycosyltransferase n=1 Tax=Micromonospora sp. NPDC005806 TaxID=3364234 RepID=UPI0036AADBBC
MLLSTYGSRGDVEPRVGLAVRVRALGAEVRMCAPRRAVELIASQSDAVTAAAEGCDVLVATGMMPAAPPWPA